MPYRMCFKRNIEFNSRTICADVRYQKVLTKENKIYQQTRDEQILKAFIDMIERRDNFSDSFIKEIFVLRLCKASIVV